MRKLATVQEIKEISPITNADFIELATILNWTVVVKKNQFKVGDKIIYFEIDSFLDTTLPQFNFLKDLDTHQMETSEGFVKRHVLRTAKRRGIYSQGLILPLSDFKLSNTLPIGADLTQELHILKYEAQIPDDDSIIGVFDSKHIPKSGAVRLQSLTDDLYNELLTLDIEPTIKIDGASVTITNFESEIKIFSREYELIKTKIHYRLAEELGFINELQKYPNMSLQMELVGPGMAKNKLKLPTKNYYIYSIWQDNKKLKFDNWPEFYKQFRVPTATQYPLQPTVKESVKMIEGIKGNVSPNQMDEGVVYTITSNLDNISANLRSILGRQKNIKIINNKFLIKNKE